MAQFQTNPWNLSDLLTRLDGGTIVLPEFQRSFVWKPPDIDLLLTSLVLDYPAGSLLFLRADPSNPLAWRTVEGVDLSADSMTPDYLVLDGQQRLTSLFDDAGAWELPPLNLLLMGTVDSIHASEIDRARFDDAWSRAEPI